MGIEINDKLQISVPPELVEAEAQYLKTVEPLLDVHSPLEASYIIHYLEDRLFALYMSKRTLS